MDYVFKVTGKGRYNAPKGLSVTIVKQTNSKPGYSEIIDAFQKQHGIKVSGMPDGYDIEKL